MKLKYLIVAVFVLAVIGIAVAGCDSSREDRELPWSLGTESRDAFNTSDNIALSIDETSLDSTNATYTITNNGVETITVGQAYSLQVFERGKWYEIECYQDWTLDVLEIAPANAVTITADWTNYYGELPEGKYRLVKEVTITDELIYLCCEFSITNN